MTADKTILCIDDTPSVRQLVRRILSQRYEVLEASEGLQGIDLAAQHHPDLILVDLHMPHLTGYEVATRIKSLLPQTPIIALSADATEHVRERALASGCDGYISKPLDPDQFLEKVEAFLGGEREKLQDERFRTEYQQTLVVRMEEKVRALTQALEENTNLNRQNRELLAKSRRRAQLLEAASRAGRSMTSILNLDLLLDATVEIICKEFDFYYATIFMVDESGTWAVLRAGGGKDGQQLLDVGHSLRVGGKSVVGDAIWLGVPCIASNATEAHALLLPLTRSEIALPLVVGGEPIGALDAQHTQESAFSEDDITALQAVADQLAVAINNARLLADLKAAHAELVHTKTFEAIATATGEAIHWVGNKAAPIPGSFCRVREELSRYMVVANALLEDLPAELADHAYAQMLKLAFEQLVSQGVEVAAMRAELQGLPLRRLTKMLSVDSIFEDLRIIEGSARSILNIKEDLIGPARHRNIQDFSIGAHLRETVASMGLPAGVVELTVPEALPLVRADWVQLERVFINLVKNAMEAMADVAEKHLYITARQTEQPGFMAVDFRDTGAGIPPDKIDKIWVAFYTTKGDRGGTGLGLSACAQIIGGLGGRITVQSEIGVGTTFTVLLPIAQL